MYANAGFEGWRIFELRIRCIAGTEMLRIHDTHFIRILAILQRPSTPQSIVFSVFRHPS